MPRFVVTIHHNEQLDDAGRHEAWNRFGAQAAQPGDLLVKIGALTVDASSPQQAADLAWEAGNSPEETPLTVAYRAWEVRSISKGDVLSVAWAVDGVEPDELTPVAVLGCESSGWSSVDLRGFVRRERISTGEAFIRKAYEDGERGPVNMPRVWERIDGQIRAMKWKAPAGRFPMTPGQELHDIIAGLELPDVSAVSHSGYLYLPDGPETATYPVYGIEANYPDDRARVYVLGAGSTACVLTVDWGVPASALQS